MYHKVVWRPGSVMDMGCYELRRMLLNVWLQDKRPPGQKATGQKATAPKGVFSTAYLNPFVKLAGIRKNIHIFIHQKVYTNNI